MESLAGRRRSKWLSATATTRCLGIPNKIILPLLEREQADVWKQLPKLPEADARFDPERMGSVGTPIDDPEIEF